MVQASPPSKHRLAGGGAPHHRPTTPLTITDLDKTRVSDSWHRSVRFLLFWTTGSGSYPICVQTHFGDSARELTTSRMSSMKGGNSCTNGSDLDKNNVIKLPTFDTLTEEGRKEFKAYRTNLKEIFLSRCEVTRQGTVLKDTTPIIFHKAELIPEIRLDPSPSCNSTQSMINFALERQAKSNDELLCRLIEERDRKKLYNLNINPPSFSWTVNISQTNPQTSGTSAGGTTMLNPSAQPMNHFHSRTTIESLSPTYEMPQQTAACMFGQGYTKTAPSFSMPNFTSAPYTPAGNGRAYTHSSGNYQALYSTVAYTDLIPLLGSSLGFLPNHAYQNTSCFNAYGQPEAGGFGYKTLP
jgi:hypothetical protein